MSGFLSTFTMFGSTDGTAAGKADNTTAAPAGRTSPDTAAIGSTGWMEKKIGAALLDAVVCMPTEICQLIGQYVVDHPHRFNANGLSEIGSCRFDEPSKTTELEIVEHNGRWRKFVSEIPLSIGETEWTVEFPELRIRQGWIGVGVTTTAGNRSSDTDPFFGLMADKTEWLLAVVYHDSWHRIHDGITSKVVRTAGPVPRTKRRVCFTADARTGIVTARFSPVDARFVSAATVDIVDVPFGLLRPCVVMAGPTKAVVRSGPPISSSFGDVASQDAVVVQVGQ